MGIGATAQSSDVEMITKGDLIFDIGTLDAGSVPGYVTGKPPQFLFEIKLTGSNGNHDFKEITLRSLRLGSVPTGEKKNLNREIRIDKNEIKQVIAKELSGFDSSLIIHIWLRRIGYVMNDPVATHFTSPSRISDSEEKLDMNDDATLDRRLFGDPTYARLSVTLRRGH